MGEPPPQEYINYILYKEFGWTPAELAAVPAAEVVALLSVMEIVGKFEKRQHAKKVKTA